MGLTALLVRWIRTTARSNNQLSFAAVPDATCLIRSTPDHYQNKILVLVVSFVLNSLDRILEEYAHQLSNCFFPFPPPPTPNISHAHMLHFLNRFC